ncbi:MAG: hypothetical protein AAGA30_18605, partial [Planctomycetota bacterium]
SEVMFKELSTAEQELYASMPMWVTIAFGVAVVTGTLGCVLLLGRSKLAVPVFVISILGIIAQQSYTFLLSDALKVVGTFGAVFGAVVLTVAFGLWFYSLKMIKKGFIK